jgi:3-hydroxyacyl-[acyl-carrier-protein] dehydratase
MNDVCGSLVLPIALDHPSFAGHFPGMPIVPGVVLLDLLLQALVSELQADPDRCKLSSAKFFSTVAPGDAVIARYRATADGRVDFHLECGERKVAAGSLQLERVHKANP